MNIEVLVSTMNQKNNTLIKTMNISTDATVINQCGKEEKVNYSINRKNIKWIDTKEKGLSRSRNMALKNATGDICLIADDDLEYIDSYKQIVIDAFLTYSDADIIAFQVEGIEKSFKNYSQVAKKVNYVHSMKISSVEIAFKAESFKKLGITFNELLGSGAKYCAGEESALLFECIKKGLKVYYVPKKIANLHIGDSSWFNGYDKKYFINKGAIFTAMSKKMNLILILQFAIRKYKIYNNDISFIEALKLMLNGRKMYNNEFINKI